MHKCYVAENIVVANILRDAMGTEAKKRIVEIWTECLVQKCKTFIIGEDVECINYCHILQPSPGMSTQFYIIKYIEQNITKKMVLLSRLLYRRLII